MAQDPNALLRKAASLEKSASGGFSFFGDRKEKFENAAEAYVSAASAFRLSKQNVQAGQAFEEAARIQTHVKEFDDAANTYQEAFKVYRKEDPQRAVDCLQKAIDRYSERNNFRRAATQKQIQAETYETEFFRDLTKEQQWAKAIEAYDKAAEWFETDNAQALANKLNLKVAEIAALQGDYYKAIENFEKVAETSVSNNLMKWSVKDYFLKAGICHLATRDMVGTNRALQKYRDMDPTFESTREHQLLIDLSEAVGAGDQEAFTGKLFLYDQLSKLDKWKTDILLKVKNEIVEVPDDFS